MKKDFTKADLKTGMVVVIRCGDEFQILETPIGLVGVGDTYWLDLNEYENDLTIRDGLLDIIKIKETNDRYKLFRANWGNMTTIWERTEEKLGSNGLSLEENHRKMWKALADNPLMEKGEYLRKNNIDIPKGECFACESTCGLSDLGECDECPICEHKDGETCLNGKFDKWLDATGFERAKIANEIANLEWKEK